MKTKRWNSTVLFRKRHNWIDVRKRTSITAVKSKRVEIDPLVLKEKEVEDYLISLCCTCAKRKRMRGEISTSEDDASNCSSAKREERVSQAIEMTNEKCQYGLSRSAIEILQLFLGNNVVLKKLLSISVFRNIIGDTNLIRSVILHFPLLSSLLALNPDFLPIIYNDNECESIINQILNAEYGISTRLEMVGNYIQNKIGHPLKLTNEHVYI